MGHCCHPSSSNHCHLIVCDSLDFDFTLQIKEPLLKCVRTCLHHVYSNAFTAVACVSVMAFSYKARVTETHEEKRGNLASKVKIKVEPNGCSCKLIIVMGMRQ